MLGPWRWSTDGHWPSLLVSSSHCSYWTNILFHSLLCSRPVETEQQAAGAAGDQAVTLTTPVTLVQHEPWRSEQDLVNHNSQTKTKETKGSLRTLSSESTFLPCHQKHHLPRQWGHSPLLLMDLTWAIDCPMRKYPEFVIFSAHYFQTLNQSHAIKVCF